MDTVDRAAGAGRSAHQRDRRWLAWTIFAFAIAIIVVGFAALLLGFLAGDLDGEVLIGQLALLPPAVSFSIVGLIVSLKQPWNACGWLMLAIGAMWSTGVTPPTPEDHWTTWALAWGWVPPFGLMATHLPLRLPDGTLLSSRWRWVSRASTAAIVVTCVGFLFDASMPHNPLANEALSTLALIGILGMAICAVLSIASLVVRSRRAGPDERHQIRWIAIGAATFIATWGTALAFTWIFSSLDEGPDLIISTIVVAFYAAIPVSIGIAILRYRLYDIDIVIRKALIVAVLAGFFIAIYALVIGGVGAVVGSTRSAALSFVSAVVAAVLFQPALERARRFADRVVYGQRATPYEVLADFGDQLAETYAADDVLPRVARVLGEGVGSDRARVWLVTDEGPQLAATWPVDADPGRDDDHRTDVRHQGELLGALSVAMPPNDPMDPAKEKLVANLAAQVGLVLRNVRLLEDLRASRRRLVAAQDEERRKLERNIHDGAQQQLVALSIKARLARQATEHDPRKTVELLEQIEDETQQAVDDLRDLARGIYPPLLADKGLAAAIEAQARKSPVPVQVAPVGVGRHEQAIEAAVYFAVLEAMQNVAKYADASLVRVRLEQEDGVLTFEVIDDGRGFDPAVSSYGTGLQGIVDRLAVLNGLVRVESSPGNGTAVRGSIPLHRV